MKIKKRVYHAAPTTRGKTLITLLYLASERRQLPCATLGVTVTDPRTTEARGKGQDTHVGWQVNEHPRVCRQHPENRRDKVGRPPGRAPCQRALRSHMHPAL